MTRHTARIAILSVAARAAALAACSKAPDTAEFVQACVKIQATQQIFECAAKAAATKLSPDLLSEMVYDMPGKRQQFAAISDRLSFDELASFAQKQFDIMDA